MCKQIFQVSMFFLYNLFSNFHVNGVISGCYGYFISADILFKTFSHSPWLTFVLTKVRLVITIILKKLNYFFIFPVVTQQFESKH